MAHVSMSLVADAKRQLGLPGHQAGTAALKVYGVHANPNSLSIRDQKGWWATNKEFWMARPFHQDRCNARMWAAGAGKQCRAKHPKDQTLCGNHNGKTLKHGVVTEPAPPGIFPWAIAKPKPATPKRAQPASSGSKWCDSPSVMSDDGSDTDQHEFTPPVLTISSSVTPKVVPHAGAYMREAKATMDLCDPIFDIVQEYVAYCVSFSPAELKQYSQEDFIKTHWGDCGKHESIFRSFVLYLRHQGGPTDGTQKRMKGSTLENKMCQLKKGLRLCARSPNDIPAWAVEGAKGSNLLRNMIQDIKTKDSSSAKPANMKGYLMENHVEEFCMYVMSLHKAGHATQQQVMRALALRFQSGLESRHAHLVRTTWGETGHEPIPAAEGDGQVPYFTAYMTKIGGLTLSQSARAVMTSKMYLTDPLSIDLFEAWCEMYGAEAEPGHYFLPFAGPEAFDFTQPMSPEQHDEACREAALCCKLAITEAHLQTFGSNCVRRGCAGTVARTAKKAIAGPNRRHGRRETSMVDLQVYAPAEILREPSPLFTDVDGIAERYNAFLQSVYQTKEVLCQACGYPLCENCSQCSYMVANEGKSSKHKMHRCWLWDFKGRRPKSGPKESDEQIEDRSLAWSNLGVQTTPHWNGGDGWGYGWPGISESGSN